jgi:hypothetical protein
LLARMALLGSPGRRIRSMTGCGVLSFGGLS